MSTAEFKEFSNAYNTDCLSHPFETYADIRRSSPIAWSPSHGAWFVTGMKEANQILKSKEFYALDLIKKISIINDRVKGRLNNLQFSLDAVTFFKSDKEHAESKKFLIQLFQNFDHKKLEAIVKDTSYKQLKKMKETKDSNFNKSYACIFPHLIMGVILGINEEHVHEIVELIDGFMVILNNACSMADYLLMDQNLGRCTQIIANELKADEEQRLIALAKNFDISIETLATRCLFLFLTGSETTSAFIGLAVNELLNHPNEYQRLINNECNLDDAMHELLRFTSPLQKTVRVAKSNQMIGNTQICAGDVVCVYIGAINRDPEIFVDPEILNLNRVSKSNAAFGLGIHYCIGEKLAKLEMMHTLINISNEFKLRKKSYSKDKYYPFQTMRKLSSLEVEFHE